jgi:prepilin-type N-terminal cleavage/methylation domain-containing protein
MNAAPAHPAQRPPRRPHARRGFTLIEVLATIVLMGIVLPVAMHGISLCMRSAQSARQRGEAAALAESKLNELVATGDWQYGLLSGDFGEAWPEYRWNGAATERADDPSLHELSVRVAWTTRGQERDVTLTTLVFESTAATDAAAASGTGQ